MLVGRRPSSAQCCALVRALAASLLLGRRPTGVCHVPNEALANVSLGTVDRGLGAVGGSRRRVVSGQQRLCRHRYRPRGRPNLRCI